MNIAVVGLGLMGGSLCKAISQRTSHQVFGLDLNQASMSSALEQGAIHAPLTDEALRQCDLVFIALYPDDAIRYLQQNAGQIKQNATVVDLCGVKELVCQQLEPLAQQKGFVYLGGHPMAGRECWGFSSSVGDLYDGASMILTPPPQWKDRADQLRPFFLSLGFGQVVYTTPKNHDKMIAYTSQLAHVVSSAYIRSPASRQHIGYSAGSYKDLTRVAKLNPDMWTRLFLENPTYLCEEIDILIRHLTQYRDAIAQNDSETLHRLLAEGSAIKESVG